MEKSLIAATTDAIVIFLGFVLSKYLPEDWATMLKGLLVAFQPVVVYLIAKWLGVELMIKAGLMK